MNGVWTDMCFQNQHDFVLSDFGSNHSIISKVHRKLRDNSNRKVSGQSLASCNLLRRSCALGAVLYSEHLLREFSIAEILKWWILSHNLVGYLAIQSTHSPHYCSIWTPQFLLTTAFCGRKAMIPILHGQARYRKAKWFLPVTQEVWGRKSCT